MVEEKNLTAMSDEELAAAIRGVYQQLRRYADEGYRRGIHTSLTLEPQNTAEPGQAPMWSSRGALTIKKFL